MKPNAPPRVAVIDIGSNAVRLLLARAGGDMREAGPANGFAVEIFARVPLPLGAEAFGGDGKISRPTARRLAFTLLGFRALLSAQEPDCWRAFATAAIREARNGGAVVKSMRKKTGVLIQPLSGTDEARIVGGYVAAQFPDSPALVCADIGGGTSDLVLARNGRVKSAASFRIGVARAAPEKRPREFARMKKWLAQKSQNGAAAVVVGRAAEQAAELCGGLSRRNLGAFRRKLAKMTPEKISAEFGIEPDRAESAASAALLYQFLLESSGAAKLQVARGGLPQALAAEMLRDEFKMRRLRNGGAQKGKK